jgi:hypothetical protein
VSCGTSKKVIPEPVVTIGAPKKTEIKKTLLEGIELSFTNALALAHIGDIKMNLYKNYIEVSFKESDLFLNPKFKRSTSYSIHSMDVALGKYTFVKKGEWRLENNSPKLILNKVFKPKNDTLNISNTKFYIPYEKLTDLKDSWIIATYYNSRGTTVYNHTQKFGHFFEELIEGYLKNRRVDDYYKQSSDELIGQQLEIKKRISYAKAEHYFNKIREGKSYAALLKMDFLNRGNSWNRVPELSKRYLDWRQSVNKFTKFSVQNSLELRRVNLAFKHDKIDKETFHNKRKIALEELKKDFSKQYENLNKKIESYHKELWLKTGEYYLKLYKSNDELFPSELIDDEELKEFYESSKYESLKGELAFLEREVIKKI